MPGGRNNYVAGAPLVKDLGKGFVVAGTVLEAATGLPVRNTRIQIWLNTARGGEAVPSNRGSVMTDEQGRYRLDTSPVVPQFGQPHVHIGYDDGKYNTLFLRPVLKSEKDPSITVDFVLGVA
jgi:protocatechuate 3,4-dioxygenase beta subunit